MKLNYLTKAVWLGLASSAMIACSNGSGTSSLGIALPSNMSLVTANDSTGSAALSNLAMIGAVTSGTFTADSDYVSDKVNNYVYDPAMEPLQTANMILCLMSQTGANQMLNQGSYHALIDEDKCEQGSNGSGASSTGQSSGGKAIKYNRWTVDATREDSESPMLVKMWIPGDENASDPNEKENILVEVKAEEGVSDANPFGIFTINFKGVTDYAGYGGSTGNYVDTMKGSLKTIKSDAGKPQFSLINLGGKAVNSNANYRYEQYTNAILDDANGTAGMAKTRAYQQWMEYPAEDNSYAIKYNSNYLNRGKDTNGDNLSDGTQCLSRTDYNTQIWRYNVYHRDAGSYAGKTVTAGQRVALNSGFPFTYDNGGKTVQGHVGYWGIWVENEVVIPSGSAIKKVDYSNGTSTDYTVKISNGKLIRRTKNTLNITKLVGQNLYFWGQNPGTSQFGQYVVTVDGSYNFMITHSMTWGNSGPELTDITDVNITPSIDGKSLWLWADALGGNVVYTHNTTVTPASTRTVSFYGEEVVNPGDSAISSGLSLACYDRCLIGGVTSLTGLTNDSSLYYASGSTRRTYTLTVSAGVLSLTDDTNGKPVDYSAFTASQMKPIQHEWGINTGSMATIAVADALTNWWDIYNADVTYRWETGSNNWNKLVSVVDTAGAVQSFDKPIQFVYQLAAGDEINNDPNSQAGGTFMLQYGGNGDLWGFPWIQNGNRWYSSVNLKNGVELTDGGGNVFIVKGIEQEQTFKTAAGQCDTLDIDPVFTYPSLGLPTEGSIEAISFGWGDKPTPDSEAPAFIGGEKQ